MLPHNGGYYIFAVNMTEVQSSAGRQRRFLTGMAHVLFIIIIFILPELVMAIAMPFRRGFVFYPGFYAKSVVFIAIFYINYFIIIDRTIGKRSTRNGILYFILANLGLLAIGIVICNIVDHTFWSPRRRHVDPNHWHQFLKFLSRSLRDGVMIVLSASLAVALRLSTKWKDMERHNQELIAEQRTTELANLKSQLNPHFLFNTLNTIYALVDISPEDAKKAVHTLSSLLRYMLYEDVKLTTLQREADFIEDYISLMRLRVADRPILVDINLGDEPDREIPPLMFIPLVENALKYGNSAPDHEPIRITIKADNEHIICETSNSFISKPADDNRKSKASGIGLANLRRRLILLYGNNASLRTVLDGNIFHTSLRINIRQD